MNCQDYQDLLSAYLDRELNAENQKGVASHLADCAKCQEEMGSLLAIKEKVRATRGPSMPAELVARIEEQTFLRSRGWEKFVIWSIPALAVAATLGAWALLYSRASVEPHLVPNIPLAQLQRRQQYLADHPQLAWRTRSDTDTTKDLQ